MAQIGFRQDLYCGRAALTITWTFNSGLVLPKRIVIPMFNRDDSISVEIVRMNGEDLLRGPIPVSLFAGSGWQVTREPSVGSRLELVLMNRGTFDLEVYGYFEFEGRHESISMHISEGSPVE